MMRAICLSLALLSVTTVSAIVNTNDPVAVMVSDDLKTWVDWATTSAVKQLYFRVRYESNTVNFGYVWPLLPKSVKLAWTEVSPATGHLIRRGSNSVTLATIAQTVDGVRSNWVDVAPLPGSNWYQVAWYNAATTSAWSNVLGTVPK